VASVEREPRPIVVVWGGVPGQPSPLLKLKAFCLSEVQIQRKFAQFLVDVLFKSICRISVTDIGLHPWSMLSLLNQSQIRV